MKSRTSRAENRYVSRSPGAVTVPASLSAGSYYLISRADDDLEVAETLETNNGRSRVIKIGP